MLGSDVSFSKVDGSCFQEISNLIQKKINAKKLEQIAFNCNVVSKTLCNLIKKHTNHNAVLPPFIHTRGSGLCNFITVRSNHLAIPTNKSCTHKFLELQCDVEGDWDDVVVQQQECQQCLDELHKMRRACGGRAKKKRVEGGLKVAPGVVLQRRGKRHGKKSEEEDGKKIVEPAFHTGEFVRRFLLIEHQLSGSRSGDGEGYNIHPLFSVVQTLVSLPV